MAYPPRPSRWSAPKFSGNNERKGRKLGWKVSFLTESSRNHASYSPKLSKCKQVFALSMPSLTTRGNGTFYKAPAKTQSKFSPKGELLIGPAVKYSPGKQTTVYTLTQRLTIRQNDPKFPIFNSMHSESFMEKILSEQPKALMIHQ